MSEKSLNQKILFNHIFNVACWDIFSVFILFFSLFIIMLIVFYGIFTVKDGNVWELFNNVPSKKRSVNSDKRLYSTVSYI